MRRYRREIAIFFVSASLYFICGVGHADQSIRNDSATRHVENTTTSRVHSIGSDNSQLAIKIESVSPLTLNNHASVPAWTYWIPSIGPALSGILALVGVFFGLRIATKNAVETIQAAQKNNEAVIWQKANEAELRDIQDKLDQFYIPFQLKSNANFQFAKNLKSRQDADYRLLVKLFDGEWRENLTKGDKKLVEIVSNNAEELRELIESKSGLVDDALLPYLSRASVHFRMLNLAFRGELGGDPELFQSYVYPRELDGVLSLEINRLRARMTHLRMNPSTCPPAQELLNIPQNLKLSS